MAFVKTSDNHLVASLLSDEDRDLNILLVELLGNIKKNKWKVNLNVIFQTIDVARKSWNGTRVERKNQTSS